MESIIVRQDLHDNTASPLLSMPIEIILRISSQLNTTDLCSFRLTCRGLENTLFSDFAHEFFSRKQFMISEFSLGALCDIAKSRMGQHLQHLHLGLETLVYGPVTLPRHLTAQQHRRCHESSAEQVWLWNSGRVLDLLTEAFGHLPNLEGVVIRDFNSRTRYRDACAEWKSYGASKMMEECGREVAHWGERAGSDIPGPNQYVTQVFAAVLVSLGRANARPKALKLYERKRHQLLDVALHIPPALEKSIAPVLGGLRELHLCIQPLFEMPLYPAMQNYYLRKFLALTPNLAELRINADRRSRESLEPFQQWLAAPHPPVSGDGGGVVDRSTASDGESTVSDEESAASDGDYWETLPPPVALPGLRTLSLGCMSITVRDLLAMMTKFKSSLDRIELWRVTLKSENASSHLLFGTRNLCLWKQFFRGLIRIPNLELSQIFIGQAQQQNPVHLGSDGEIHFIQDYANLITDTKIDYHGKNWREYINGLSMIFSRHLSKLKNNDSFDFEEFDSDESTSDEEMEESPKDLRKKLIHRVRRGGNNP